MPNSVHHVSEHPSTVFPVQTLAREGQGGGDYEDVPGFCKSATLKEIEAHGHVLTPGRYVGAEEIEDDSVPFEEKMAELSAELFQQMKEAEELDASIRHNLKTLGFGE